MTDGLFTPLTLRDATFRNRIVVSPMCQYSTGPDGIPHDWHLVHLGQFAVGGASLVIAEATSVSPEGRLSLGDTGLWNDEQARAWSSITPFIRNQGALAGIQLGHAGRKASTLLPWVGEGYLPSDEGGWTTIGPSPIGFGSLPPPEAMDHSDIDRVVRDFEDATRRAAEAGFDVVELHAAHGYLIHQFLSPISNQRTDHYGGPFENRVRLLSEIVEAMRDAWPAERPLFVRMSATDWVEGGWDLEQTIEASRIMRQLGVDLIDCSSGGMVPNTDIPVGPGYQVPLARDIRTGAEIATGAVGRITEATQADDIVRSGSADVVLLGKELLRRPHWPLFAAMELGADVAWPRQYATPRPSPEGARPN